MKIISSPNKAEQAKYQSVDLFILLFDISHDENVISVGGAIKKHLIKNKLKPASRVLDLLSIALSIIAVDHAVLRSSSPDGWTREIELHIAVNDVDFWNLQIPTLNSLLQFLTNDIWELHFISGGYSLPSIQEYQEYQNDCVSLLSGGLDSLVGGIDLVSLGKNPLFVSQVVNSDSPNQTKFAKSIIEDATYLCLNHNASIKKEGSTRARSIIFLTYGILGATCLKNYNAGHRVNLYICENGFISINPPLTRNRLGSLSTRTSHPVYIKQFQLLLDEAGINVQIINPYQYKTKGEMLIECTNQDLLKKLAHESTSCGRYSRMGRIHCGRCVPCLIRRASFLHWGIKDLTNYKYNDLSIDNNDHKKFDDVCSAAMAIHESDEVGLERWLSPYLNSYLLGDTTEYHSIVQRGFSELREFLKKQGVI
jgi:hypothetical protein